jgi:hypothetical protein
LTSGQWEPFKNPQGQPGFRFGAAQDLDGRNPGRVTHGISRQIRVTGVFDSYSGRIEDARFDRVAGTGHSAAEYVDAGTDVTDPTGREGPNGERGVVHVGEESIWMRRRRAKSDERRATGDGRRATGDGRRATGDGRRPRVPASGTWHLAPGIWHLASNLFALLSLHPS